MAALIITTVLIALLVAAALAGVTGIGAADTRDPDWNLFPLSGRGDNASPRAHTR